METEAFLLMLTFLAWQATSLKMDAAYYDDLENKSYFYHNDRYFVFDHSPSGISLSDEGSLRTKMPWLPLPLDAVYKRNQKENGRKNLQVYVVGGRRYRMKGKTFDSNKMPQVAEFFDEPDAVAHDPDDTVRIFFKGTKCLRTIVDPDIRKRVKMENPENVTDLFKNAPVIIDAAMIINKRILLFGDELVWSYDVTRLPANLMEGYPRQFKDLFQGVDNVPTISTSLRYASKRLVGHIIEEEWIQSLNECFEVCLALPFLACSSINFSKERDNGLHRCEINKYKERQFPQDLTTTNEFVYYEVYW